MFIRHRQPIAICDNKFPVPGLHRYYGAGYLHYITTSCYHRRAWLAAEANRDLFVEVLEQVRRRYHFVVVGYVVMPEHIHLLLSEPERGNPSVVMQAIKQGVRAVLALPPALQPRPSPKRFVESMVKPATCVAASLLRIRGPHL
jgi:transposase IS200 family protein